MRQVFVTAVAVVAMSFGAASAFAADPSMHQIYEAAEAGRLPEAQRMIEEVLRDHPASAKAHYVQAELFAREGKTASARAELGRAEQLQPGLSFAKPESVRELKSELSVMRTHGSQGLGSNELRNSGPHFPWSGLLIAVLIGGAIWMLFRRRTPAPSYATVLPGPGPSSGPYASPYGVPPAGPMGGGGMGSGLGSSLATGLAVGAGVVAGEELAHHLLDGGRRESVVMPPAQDDNDWRSSNADMGGTDFGINDTSWDDGGSSGGGDDWT